MSWITVCACVVAGWSLLKIISVERIQRLEDLKNLELPDKQGNRPEIPVVIGSPNRN
jgi:hypothetical protein